MRILEKRKNVTVRINFVQAQLFSHRRKQSEKKNNQFLESLRFSLKLMHKNKHFQSVLFKRDKYFCILLQECQTVILHHQLCIPSLNPYNNRKFSSSFLKIVLCSPETMKNIQTVISDDVLLKIVMSNTTNGCCLYFPMFDIDRTVVAQIGMTILVDYDHDERKRYNSKKVVLSRNGAEYFVPVYSTNEIRVSVQSDSQEEKQQPTTIQQIHPINQAYNISQVLSSQQIPIHQNKQQLQITNIQQRSPNATSQALQQQQAQLKPKQYRNEPSRTKWLVEHEQPANNNYSEDYLYLFRKITQINRKYQPLERIQSQQSLPSIDQSPSLNHLSKSASDDSWHSDISYQQINRHLSQSQSLLNELHLYKYGRSLLENGQQLFIDNKNGQINANHHAL